MTPAPPVLFLPGHMCDERAWGPVAERLAAAGVVIEHARLDRDATIAGMASRVLDEAPDKFVAVGFSMGAIVALALARAAPGRVAGLCLTAVNPGADLAERAAARRLHQDRVRRGDLAALTREHFVPAYLAARNAQDEGLAQLCVDMALAVGADAFVRQSEALRGRPDGRAALADIRCPTLVIGGLEDQLCPPAWHREVAAAIPGAALRLFEHAGHMVLLERSEDMADAILHWLTTAGLAPRQAD